MMNERTNVTVSKPQSITRALTNCLIKFNTMPLSSFGRQGQSARETETLCKKNWWRKAYQMYEVVVVVVTRATSKLCWGFHFIPSSLNRIVSLHKEKTNEGLPTVQLKRVKSFQFTSLLSYSSCPDASIRLHLFTNSKTVCQISSVLRWGNGSVSIIRWWCIDFLLPCDKAATGPQNQYTKARKGEKEGQKPTRARELLLTTQRRTRTHDDGNDEKGRGREGLMSGSRV